MRRALPLLVGVGLLLAAAGGVPLLVGGDDTAETPSGAPMARVVVPDLSAEAGGAGVSSMTLAPFATARTPPGAMASRRRSSM